MKKIISIILIISMVVSSFGINTAFAEVASDEELKDLDVSLFENLAQTTSGSAIASYTVDKNTEEDGGYYYVTITFENMPDKVSELGFYWSSSPKELSENSFYTTERMDFFENASLYNKIPLKDNKKTVSFCFSKNNLSNNYLYAQYRDDEGSAIKLYENKDSAPKIPASVKVATPVINWTGWDMADDSNKWDIAYENLDKVTDVLTVSEMFKKLDLFTEYGVMVKGSNTLRYRFPTTAFYEIQANKNTYKNSDDFKSNMVKVLFFTAINTYNYFGLSLNEYVPVADKFNYSQFSNLTENEKLAVMTVLRLYNGYAKEARDEIDPYTSYDDFFDFYERVIDSVGTASYEALAGFTDGTESVQVGDKKTIANFTPAGTGEKIIFDSDQPDILRAGTELVSNDGEIHGIKYGSSNISYLRVRTDSKHYGEILGYGILALKAEDYRFTPAYSYRQEAGRNNMMMIVFAKPMDVEVNDVMELSQFASELKIGGNTLDISEGKAEWITKQVAKVTFKETDVKEGDILKLTFNDIKIEDGSESIKDKVVTTEPAVADVYGPVGKIIPVSGNVNSLEVVFNELIPDSSKTVIPSEAIKSIILTKEDGSTEDITSKASSLSWDVRDGNGRSQMTIGFSEAVNVGDTDYFTIKYTDKIKDYSGNTVDSSPKAIVIGGGFIGIKDYTHMDAGTASILDNIRNQSGGKTPKIALSSSSDESYDSSWDYFYNSAAVQAAYGFALRGMEPVIAEVTADSYTDTAVVNSTVEHYSECTGMFGPGGDQAMNSRAYLKDDGSDTIQMRAMRQIFHSGGVISGSSAGDHSQSNPMLNGGNSTAAITKNKITTNKVTEYKTESDGTPLIMKGFGFVSDYGLTDSHVNIRGRLGRIVVALKHLQDLEPTEQIDRTKGIEKGIGIGVDENTSITIIDGVGEVHGASGVMISDISGATFPESSIFAARNVRLSYLTSGDKYDFNTKAVTSAKPAAEEKNIGQVPSENIFPNSDDSTRTQGPEALIKNLVQSTAKSNYGRDKANKEITAVFNKDSKTKGYYKSATEFTVSQLIMNIDTFDKLDEMTLKSDSTGGSGSSKSNNAAEVTVSKEIKNGNLVIKISDVKDKYVAEITGKELEKLVTDEGNIIEFNTPIGSYSLPVEIEDIIPELSSLIKENNLKLNDVIIEVSIEYSKDKKISSIIDRTAGSDKLIGAPVNFTLKIFDGKTKKHLGDIAAFNSFITRTIILPENVANLPEFYAVFKVDEKNSALVPVPHRAYYENGRWNIKIVSNTNSVYGIAENHILFDDVKDDFWGREYIENAASKMLIKGVGGSRFNPESNVTKADFVRMIVNILPPVNNSNISEGYKDVTSDKPYYDIITAARAGGYLNDFKGDYFNPEDAITREEMASVIAGAFGNIFLTGSAGGAELIFKDMSDGDEKFTDSIKAVVSMGIMQGTSREYFSPKGSATRAQAATVQYRIFNQLGLIK